MTGLHCYAGDYSDAFPSGAPLPCFRNLVTTTACHSSIYDILHAIIQITINLIQWLFSELGIL